MCAGKVHERTLAKRASQTALHPAEQRVFVHSRTFLRTSLRPRDRARTERNVAACEDESSALV
ncbi:MAG: hypothetical protein D6695_00770 [Planctomycetota bacterium]|nr:MAG: hypothetical protein D6695_00770 [Planctomycetota bacterium]